MRFPNVPVLSTIRPAVATHNAVVRDHCLPGDTYAGRDLAECAARWGTLGETVFVRLRVVTPGLAHAAVLTFDADGFGTVVSAPVTPGLLPLELRPLLDAPHAVVLADDMRAADMLLIDGVVELRTFDRLRAFESDTLGVRREDADLDPEVWAAARGGDPSAARWVAAAARADLFSLVAMAGGDVTLH